MYPDQKLTVKDILKRPQFRETEVIAGHDGLDRHVKWVHIIEMGSNQSFINGNELILTTGFFFDRSKKVYLSYLRDLIQQNASALCIDLGSDGTSIPPDMIEIAVENHFPLIVLPRIVKFVEITTDLHTLLISRHAKALRDLESFSKELTRFNLQSQSNRKILQTFHQMISLQVMYYPVQGNPIFIPQINVSVQREALELLKVHFETDSSDSTAPSQLRLSQQNILLYQPVVVMGQIHAYVGIIVVNREVDEYLALSLDYSVTAIAQNLLRRLFIEERNLKNQSLLLDEILNNRLQSEELLRTKLGLSQSDICDFCFYCGVIEWVFPSLDVTHDEWESIQQSVVIMIRTIMNRHHFHSVILSLGNRIYFLVYQTQIEEKHVLPLQERINKAIRLLISEVTHLLENSQPLIGMSRPAHLLIHAHQGFQEAKKVIEISKITESRSDPFYENIGVFGILLSMRDNQSIHSLILDNLSKVIEHDKVNGSELLQTLQVYLNNNGSKQETAKKLYIHRQTFYYRLEKLKELLGDFMKPERRICIELALRAYDFNRIHSF